MMVLYRLIPSNRIIFPVAFAAFLAFDYSLPAPLLNEIMNAIQVAFGIVILVVYSSVWRDVFIKNVKMTAVHHLALGVHFSWLSIVAQRSYFIIQRKMDSVWMLHNYRFLSLICFCGIIGGILHLTAPEKIKTLKLNSRGWHNVAVAFMLGFALATIVFVIEPSLIMVIKELGAHNG